MKQMKFRVYNKRTKRFFYYDGIFGHTNNHYIPDNTAGSPTRWDDIVIQQVSGLRDKNGKEIYEGDILKDQDDSFCHVFQGKSGEWLISYFEGNFAGVGLLITSKTDEVIGNIFENPKLLQKTS